MGHTKCGRENYEAVDFLLMHADKFFAWLEENNEKAKQPKKKWNNGEKTPQMGRQTERINWDRK